MSDSTPATEVRTIVLRETDETDWWQRILDDARSVDQHDSWEVVKLTAGVEAAVRVNLLSREQAQYIHGMINRDASSDATIAGVLQEQREQQWWKTILNDVRSVDARDAWQRTKIVVAAGMLQSLNILSDEQTERIESMIDLT